MSLYEKYAKVLTPLKPYQQRVVDKLLASHGLLVVHGLGSGKCGRGSTPILTNHGIVPLASIFGDKVEGPERELTLPGGDYLVAAHSNGEVNWIPVRARYRQRLPNTETTLQVSTHRGGNIEVTRAHPLLVVREGVPTWVPAGLVQVGEPLVVAARVPEPTDPADVSVDLAVFLAWQIAEGNEHPDKGAFLITQNDEEVLKELARKFQRVCPVATAHVTVNSHGYPILRACSRVWRNILEQQGYVWGRKSAGKAFPPWLLQLSSTTLREVLRAFFSAEGHTAKANIELTSASKTIAVQLQYALLRFGVRSAIHAKQACATNGTRIKRTYWRLSISGEDRRTFLDRVGFSDSTKQTRLRKSLKETNPNYGVPIKWFVDAIKKLGVTPKILGLSANPRETVSLATGRSLAEKLRVFASPDGREDCRKAAKRCSGTAGRYAVRTLEALTEHADELCRLSDRLAALCDLDVRFERVTAIVEGERGGFVYDLEVDSDDYDAKNYIAGMGALVCHNTLSSIAASDALGMPIDAIVPAPLQANYEKELLKHLGEVPEGTRIRSYEKAVRDKDVNPNSLVVMDEAHRARNSGTLIAKDVANAAAKAKARVLLTGTPVYNNPSDLANLLNTAAGRKVLPDDPNLFKQTFVGQKTVQAPLLTRWKGTILGHPVDTETFPTLINRERMIQAARGYVDVHKGGGEGFPDRVDEVHHVTMSPKQMEMYSFAEGKMPWYLRSKIRAGLPMNKQESKELNAFQGALRQIANTPRGYAQDINDENETEHAPKIQKMVEHLQDARRTDPNHRGLVYSNFLESGIHPLSRALTKAGIPHHVFTGEVGNAQRAQMVKDYNSGKTPVLLVSGAGSEGLDLKGTKTIQLMEPHWNDSRLNQVIGRGIRYLSHEHLPENERKVRVMRYHAAFPKEMTDGLNWLSGIKNNQTIDGYLQTMSDTKSRLVNEISEALQAASDYGPLRKTSEEIIHEKIAGSALRDRVRVETTIHPQTGAPIHQLLLGDEVIGHVMMKHDAPNTVRHTYIKPQYRGLGLGSKMYGEAIRNSPLGPDGRPTLGSDGSVSSEAQRVWRSAESKPGYQVTTHKWSKRNPRTNEQVWNLRDIPLDVTMGSDDGLFRASLPAEAHRPGAVPRITAQDLTPEHTPAPAPRITAQDLTPEHTPAPAPAPALPPSSQSTGLSTPAYMPSQLPPMGSPPPAHGPSQLPPTGFTSAPHGPTPPPTSGHAAPVATHAHARSSALRRYGLGAAGAALGLYGAYRTYKALSPSAPTEPVEKTSARAPLSGPDPEFMQRLISHVGDSSLARVKRKNVIVYKHPTGLTLHSPYDEHHVHKELYDKFDGDEQRMGEQLRDDMLNMGFATLGGLATKNEKQKKMRSIQGASYGALAGLWLNLADLVLRRGDAASMRLNMGLMKQFDKLHPVLGVPLSFLTPYATQGIPALIGGTAGFQIGKRLGSGLGVDDVTAQNTHPLLMAPKEIKAKVKLDVKEK